MKAFKKFMFYISLFILIHEVLLSCVKFSQTELYWYDYVLSMIFSYTISITITDLIYNK